MKLSQSPPFRSRWLTVPQKLTMDLGDPKTGVSVVIQTKNIRETNRP